MLKKTNATFGHLILHLAWKWIGSIFSTTGPIWIQKFGVKCL